MVLLHVGTLLRLGETGVQAYVKRTPRLQVMRYLDVKHPPLGPVYLDSTPPANVWGHRHLYNKSRGRYLHFPRGRRVCVGGGRSVGG